MIVCERIQMTIAVFLSGRHRSDRGASMVEYAILVAGMAIIVAAAVVVLGPKITAAISGISL